MRCTFRHSPGNEAQKQPGRGHAFILSQPDIAPALTLATTLPMLNRQEHRVRESTEAPPYQREDSRAAPELRSAIRDNAEKHSARDKRPLDP
jgi:hypothetical protein